MSFFSSIQWRCALLVLLLLQCGVCFSRELAYSRQFSDVPRRLLVTKDGGYLLIGGTERSFNSGDDRAWVMKTGAGGRVQWQKTLGSGIAESVVMDPDGSFTLGASSRGDIRVFHLSHSGKIEWQKTYKRPATDGLLEITSSANGGYLIAAVTGFPEKDGDAWILRLDARGNIKWQYSYGGPFLDVPMSSRETKDGGWIIAGYTKTFDSVGQRCWMVKLRPSGSIEWQTAFGAQGDAYGTGVQLTEDGGYAVAGAYSDGKDFNAYLTKLDSLGKIQWAKSYGGKNYEQIIDFEPNGTGGFLLAGDTGSYIHGLYGNAWIISVDASGNILWQNSYGTDQGSFIASLHRLKNGSIASLASIAQTSTGQDWWLLFLGPEGEINSNCDLQIVSTSEATPVEFPQFTTKWKARRKPVIVSKPSVSTIRLDYVSRPVCK